MTVYILTKLDDNGDYSVKAYADKYKAADDVMEEIYGEDWEIQLNDEAWEDASSIDMDYTDLLGGETITDSEGVVWNIVESEVIE